jgi:hypothetical protein
VNAQAHGKPEDRFRGMTVNERLFETGLLEKWDNAARTRDRRAMIEILSQVDLGNQAERLADVVLASPSKLGL